VLVLDRGVRVRPLLFGGGQEHGLRSGTENVAGCVGLARALALADARLTTTLASLAELRGIVADGLRTIPGARLLTPGAAVSLSPAIAAVLLPAPPAEVWMHHLETHGVMTSVGSACQARKGELSPAFSAIGLTEDEARGVLRLSFSRDTNAVDVVDACERIVNVARELKAASR